MSARPNSRQEPFGRGQIRFWCDPALPYLEVRQAWEVRSNYVPHTHPGLSLGLVDSGTTLFRVHGHDHQICSGTAVLIPPDEVHSCNPVPNQPWANRMIYLAPEGLGNFIDESMPLHRHLSLPCVLGRGEIYRKLEQLAVTLCACVDPLVKEDALQHILQQLLPASRDTIRPLPAQWLKRIQDYLAAHCTEPLRLDTLCAEANLSRYHLIRSFKTATGMTPHARLLDLRINLARDMLKNTRLPFAEIALQTGFADQSHFIRSFKERVAVTPGQYRQNMQ